MGKKTGSRVFHGLMIIPCVILCLISIISFSTFTAEHNTVKKDATSYLGKLPERHCVLFVKSTGKEEGHYIGELGHNGPCFFSIWGQVSVCIASLLLGIWFLLKLLVGIKMLTCLLLFEMVFITLTALLDFVVAIVITAGLNETCGSVGTTASTCEYNTIEFGEGRETNYFPNINTSKATAWIGTVLLIALATIYMILICFYCRRQKSPPEPPPYEPMKNEVNEKPVAV